MIAPPPPSILDVLRWVAGSSGEPWFPSKYSEEHGLDRASLDTPLWELREAGLVQVSAWEKGLGQGFRLTPEGALVLVRPETIPSMNVATGVHSAADDDEEELPAVVSPALLFANVTWFAVGLFISWKLGVGVEFLKADGHPGAVQMLYKIGAVTGLSVLQGGWWRLATCCFVHMGLFHLLCNMLTLGMLGPVVEGLWGKRRFAVIYGVSGLVGSMVAIALHPQTTFAGASGALWGVLAAMIAWLIGHRQELRPGVAADWARKLALIVFINLLISLAPQISMEGHLGGGIAGFLAALCLDWHPKKSPRRKALGILGAVGVLAAGVALLLGAMRYSEKWDVVRERDRVQQIDRDRNRVQAAVGERMGKVNIVAVYSLREQAKAPLVVGPRRLPQSTERVHSQARELKANADEASLKSQSLSGVTVERYRVYFARVAEFAETLEGQVGQPQPDIAAVMAKLRETDMAWRIAIGK